MENSKLLYKYDEVKVDEKRTATDVRLYQIKSQKENVIELILTFRFSGQGHKCEISYMNYSVKNLEFKDEFELSREQFEYSFKQQFDKFLAESKGDA